MAPFVISIQSEFVEDHLKNPKMYAIKKNLGRKGEIQMRGFSRFGSLTKVKKEPIKTLLDGHKYATADASKERGDHTLYGS